MGNGEQKKGEGGRKGQKRGVQELVGWASTNVMLAPGTTKTRVSPDKDGSVTDVENGRMQQAKFRTPTVWT